MTGARHNLVFPTDHLLNSELFRKSPKPGPGQRGIKPHGRGPWRLSPPYARWAQWSSCLVLPRPKKRSVREENTEHGQYHMSAHRRYGTSSLSTCNAIIQALAHALDT